MTDQNETKVRINGREISVKLTYGQLDILFLFAKKIGRLVEFTEIETAFAEHRRNFYEHNKITKKYGWNCRVHITAINIAIRPHGFEIRSKRSAGYKLIDKVNQMTDPRDDFETIYATRHLHGDTESMKTLRNDAGGYDYNDHIQDCYYIYLMAISKNKGE